MKGKYKLLHEDDTHFLMQHPDGRHFAVAKKAIHAVTGHQIRKMSPGGEVGDDQPNMSTEPAEDTAKMTPIDPPAESNASAAPSAPSDAAPVSVAPNPNQAAVDERIAMRLAQKAALYGGMENVPQTEKQKAQLEGLTDVAQKTDAAGSQAEKSAALTSARQQAIDLAKKKLGLDSGSAPEVSATTKVPSVGIPQSPPETPKGIDPLTDSQNQQQLAATGLALENSKEAKSNAAIQNANVAVMQKAKADADAKTAVMNQQNDQLFKDITEQKIDPNHYWKDHSRITAAIAVMLGGLGQGFAHGGPNQGLEVINKGIERDIDAQKAELGKKETLLSKNLERTKDMQQALNMTYSQLSTVAAAQVAANASKYGSKKAIYDGQFIVAGLKQQAMQQNYNMNVLAAKADLYGPSGITSGERGPQAQAGSAQTGVGKPINPFLVANDKELAEKIVKTGERNGVPLYSVANDKDAAKELNTLHTQAGTIKDNIEQMKKLATLGNAIRPEQRKVFENLASETTPLLLQMHGVKRFNLDEANRLSSILGNMNSGVALDTTIPALNQTSDFIDNLVERSRQNNIFNYRKPFKPTK